jgi:hypothetical protein
LSGNPTLATKNTKNKASAVQSRGLIEYLEKKLVGRDEVLAELMAEHISLKKAVGEL